VLKNGPGLGWGYIVDGQCNRPILPFFALIKPQHAMSNF
jgi:hypothetical protein